MDPFEIEDGDHKITFVKNPVGVFSRVLKIRRNLLFFCRFALVFDTGEATQKAWKTNGILRTSKLIQVEHTKPNPTRTAIATAAAGYKLGMCNSKNSLGCCVVCVWNVPVGTSYSPGGFRSPGKNE